MTMPSRWHDPPRLRTLDDEDERHATWLELFFDLVFVVAVAQLADGLAADPSVHGFLDLRGSVRRRSGGPGSATRSTPTGSTPTTPYTAS